VWSSRTISTAALLCLPAGLTAYLAFNSGGFYPGAPAYVAIVLCVVLVLRVTIAGNPFEGFSWPLAGAAGALAAFALLTLLSATWSHAPGTALVEFDLPLIFLLGMVLFGSIGHSRDRLRLWLWVLAATITGICVCGLTTRLLPHLWPTTPGIANNRLSFPLTYWNALGLLAVFGIVLCVHFCSDLREPRAGRVAAAAALPVLATTLYFTFSRGSMATAVIVIVVYALIARPRGFPSFVLSAAPASAVAVVVAYHANLLATPNPTSAGAVVQGHHVAAVLPACVAGAALLRAALLWLDLRLGRLTIARLQGKSRWAWALLAGAAVIVAVALSGTIVHQFHRFVRPQAPGNTNDLRARLTDPGNDGRIPVWRVAWHGFEAAPAVGNGAGTFADTWTQHRSVAMVVQDAHSLYMEVLDELGVVGLLLLLASIITVLVGVVARARGPDRALYAAVFAVLLAWAIHAGIDWDWEMPVITLVFFSLGGYVLARRPVPGESPSSRLTRAPVRTVLGVGSVMLAVAPAYVWLSQRKLDQANYAFSQGDCRSATRAARASISILGDRPDPYEILGYCDVRGGRPNLAITAINKAISLDPRNWNYRYDLAVMRAAAGLNPLPAARVALRMNRLEPLVQDEWQTFSADTPRQWQSDGAAIARQFTSV
jgi:O-Antigen ligase